MRRAFIWQHTREYGTGRRHTEIEPETVAELLPIN